MMGFDHSISFREDAAQIVSDRRTHPQEDGGSNRIQAGEASLYGKWGTAWRQNFQAERGTCCYTGCKHDESRVAPASEIRVLGRGFGVERVRLSYANFSIPAGIATLMVCACFGPAASQSKGAASYRTQSESCKPPPASRLPPEALLECQVLISPVKAGRARTE
jgi:hypothetical protein